MASCVRLLAFVIVVSACAHHDKNNGDGGVDGVYVPDACEGLRCFQYACEANGKPPTQLTGTVYAPNGTLPLYGVTVYVPAGDPGALVDGVTCDKCATSMPGDPIAQALTDEKGEFVLPNVPATSDVPVVVQIGKWRKRFTVPQVAACQTTAVPVADTTLPKTKMEGDIPKIAITTGGADALDCLVRKLGIADSEITTDTQAGRVHLYFGNGAAQFANGFPGGTGAFTNAVNLWNDLNKLKQYDVVIFSCEGSQNPGNKPQAALQNVHDYADLGGRVFASHWHNIWIGGEANNPMHSLPDWRSVATFNLTAANPSPDSLTATIDEVSNPKGMSFAQWMLNVGGSTTKDLVPITGARATCTGYDPTKSERWVHLDPATSPNVTSVQDLLFTTPNQLPPEERCGKVVFSDMHVSSNSSSSAGVPYPGGCSTTPMTPQEKALAFILFDISSCVGSIF